jgi:thioredoxin reductase (NADPH)
MIGAAPRTAWLPPAIQRDDRGYILTGDDVAATEGEGVPSQLETSVPGVFAVGDVRAGSMKRVAAAVGEGSTVIRLVHEYLASQQPVEEPSPHPVQGRR